MSPDPRPVRRCLCFQRTFADLKSLAQERGLRTVEQIAEATGCGSGCGLCRPYLALMIETGETAFPVLSFPTDAQRLP